MVGSSKILTVSYGTFSCTLEGFDDSFGTMKAIAEYFRDLAADDRYFGAEPPVPDAEMLSRIAEREVARRVEARLDGSAVTLRTGTALTPQPIQAAAAAIAPPDIAATPAADLPEAAIPPAQLPVMPPRAKPIMRQVITRSEPTAAAAVAAPASDSAADTLPSVAASRPAERTSASGTEQPVAETPTAFVLPAHPDADSVAAKLQRIRAVVGRGVIPFATQDYAEDLGDAPALTPEDASLSTDKNKSLLATWNDLADLADEPDDAMARSQDQAVIEDSFDMSSLTAALAGDASLVEADQDMADTLPEEEPDSAPAPIRARVIRVRRVAIDQEGAEPVGAMAGASQADWTLLGEAELPHLDALSELMALDGIEQDAALDQDMAEDAAAMLAASEEIDLDLGSVDQKSDLDLDLDEGTLPPDAEAELLQELAEVEREADLAETLDAADDDNSVVTLSNVTATSAPDPLSTDDIAALLDAPPGDDEVFDFSAMPVDAKTQSLPEPEEAVAEDAEVTPTLRLGRDLLEREPEADAEALERIISQTDAELNSPENSRRREAIAQLKAAVAATEAARRLGETQREPVLDEVETAFRDDLKQVVRPRRPVGEVSPEQRSERPRPAPLKLVASQRIDIPPPRPAPKPILPVRPRRVSVQEDVAIPAPVASPSAAGSFAEFAANMGATELPDLLEAAAAYTSFVEGVEDFSRPQLMKKVQDMTEQDFSREDGLRSFGTLLRQGRIMKTANGRFVVSEETRFKPERKSA